MIQRTAGDASDVLQHIHAGTDLIVPIANGEPVALLDAIEAAAPSMKDVRVHQMHALRDRPYLHGTYGSSLRHISYFLSHVTRPRFAEGHVELVPNHFSEMYPLLRDRCPDPLVIATVAPPDRHGYMSLGVNADYVASFIGRARFFVEVNEHMPRTFGRNQLHMSQVLGWTEHHESLVEITPVEPDDLDRRIASFVAERIPHGATIQTGIGAIPNAILSSLTDHRNLGVHTELLSDGLIDLVETGVVNGVRKRMNRTKTVGTFALGTQRLYDFLAENPAVELWPVSYVNDPRRIAGEPYFVSINATVEIDLLGQCASETIGGHYWSSSGGQGDFARGAMYSEGGQGFIVCHSTAHGGKVSRIVPSFVPGTVVTTHKNTVDKVVTEFGVAELRGRTVRERAEALIAIAHPDHRDTLRFEGHKLGYL
ncbi:MAG: acetyl-CoA hydrolase/transferase family protein [Acidimicrobiia bacterium]